MSTDRPQTDAPRLFVYVNNHFDPMWRRCWERRFAWDGRVYVAYADLEAYYMLDNLALAQAHPEYKFAAESTLVVRKFLERYPEHRETLAQLAQEGRFEVTGVGEVIVDSNMILGESLVRNYVVGLRWIEEVLDHVPRLGVRNDAFGNSAQLPQILRGCELPWTTGLSYTRAEGIYWRGLDGSTIVHTVIPMASMGGGNTKYPPCPACMGMGEVDGAPCDACGGRGIEMVERAWLPGDIHAAATEAMGAALVLISPEELLPNPALIDWVKTQRDHYDVQFAVSQDLYPYVAPWLEAIDAPPEADVHPGVELNPNNSGCWVTRIKTKQTCRRQEYALLGVETLAVMAALQNRLPSRATQSSLNEIWQDLFFTMFHDAITATHVDPAYEELQTVWGKIDAATAQVRDALIAELVAPESGDVTVLNLTAQPTTDICTLTLLGGVAEPALVSEEGTPVSLLDVQTTSDGITTLRFVAADVPGFGTRSYRLVPGDETPTITALPTPTIENARFRIEADDQGLLTVTDKVLDRVISVADAYRPAELILEHDEGSPWATLHPDQERTRLSPHTRLVRAEQGPDFQRLIFEIKTPRELGFAGTALTAQVTVTLVDSLERVDIHVDADWNAFNHRLRLAMPVPFAGEHVYEIPYGMLTREPYPPTFNWIGANGDWPTINWAGVQGPEISVALLNKGMPSYRIEPVNQEDGADAGEIIWISLLRSPTIPTYLDEPEFYTMTAWDGMRDAGHHSFDIALAAYGHPFAESTVVADADGYNAGLLAVPGQMMLPAMPTMVSETSRIAAIKQAEEGRALVLRLQEFRGRGGDATVQFPFPVGRVAKVSMLERHPAPLEVEAGAVQLAIRPWEIATLRVELPTVSAES